MSSHDEKAAWEEAQQAEDRNVKPTKANGGRRNAPFYKVLQGMPIAVDAFRYGAIPNVTAYFLTHAHSDHYTNLSSNWKNGLIYCSETTANLVVHMLSVDKKWVRPLPMNVPTVVPNSGGVTVTLIEANHCPGSCLFFFEGKQTVNAGDSSFKSNFVGSSRIFRYLHCGDFRACPHHVLHPSVKGKKIDTVYLDTTYLNPKYCFPPQPQVVSACAELVRRVAAGESIDGTPDAGSRTSLTGWFNKSSEASLKACGLLIVVGTYSIGKERIVKGIAKSLNSKIFCDGRKTAILRCEDDDELLSMLTNDPCDARVHVVPLGTVSSDRLGDYIEKLARRKDSSRLKWERVIAFRPTGWTFTPPAGMDMSPSISKVLARDMTRAPFTYAQLKPIRANAAPVSVKSKITVYGVPYSEHSSFFELTCFALSCDWVRMIATVNVGSAASRAKMSSWVAKWEKERERRRSGEEDVVVPYRSEDYW
ncbi:DRMBL-domain-containing protein [Schizopora paradoxa]|uniref:DRMBL-domain-containing protein n=1 Tax=Schizopora paradoxa TaxID=27342 RepID=A0A0H2RA24_9AGAM|nr:DRMBL-domain-containing protein [Schizopora paradoxa]